jgi:hypothetical protein
MANSLLDFVMSLVRDPDAAAHYAADPAQAIADAHLTDVSSVDVNNLIPVVSESLASAAPAGGLDAFGAEPAGNVWASGAATAAFDAFADHVPDTSVIDTHSVITEAVDHSVPASALPVDTQWAADAVSSQFDAPVVDDVPPVFDDVADDWAQPVVDDHPGDHIHDQAAAFDLFD